MKKLLIIGTLIIGAVTFAANGTGTKRGNAQPNGMTRMEANNGICVVSKTTERANAGEFLGNKNEVRTQATNGVRKMDGSGRQSGKGKGQRNLAKQNLNNNSTTSN
nr:hypothetical protein [uncultured Cetobacterium sp.]